MTILLIAVYLAAIMAANLLVAHYGPAIAPWTALAFIGLDLSTRDALHDLWRRGRGWKMSLLIAGGSIASWLVNLAFLDIPNLNRVAAASAVAFALSASADWGVYQLAIRRPWWQRVNSSNVVGAAVDSALFLPLAFGGFLPATQAWQFVAKVTGGALWSIPLNWLKERRGAVLADDA